MLSEFRRLRLPASLRSCSSRSSLLAGLLAGPSAAVALEVEQIVSPRGIKAWLVEEHSIPLVAIKFAFMGGAAQDPTGKEGLADMISDLLTEGAGDMPARTFKEKLSGSGTRLSACSGTGRDLRWAGDAVEAVCAIRRVAPAGAGQSALRCRFDREGQGAANSPISRAPPMTRRELALDRWYVEAFPGHPYGRPADGTPEIDRADHRR